MSLLSTILWLTFFHDYLLSYLLLNFKNIKRFKNSEGFNDMIVATILTLIIIIIQLFKFKWT
jgi:hypothetical protein